MRGPSVKLITAIIHPSRLDVVKNALQAFDVHGLTVGPVSAHSWLQGRVEIYRGVSYLVDLLPRTRLELLATDHEVSDLIRVIAAAAGTGRGGDGRHPRAADRPPSDAAWASLAGPRPTFRQPSRA